MKRATVYLFCCGLTLVPMSGQAQKSVLRYQLPNGNDIQIHIDAPFPAKVQQLQAGQAPKPGIPVLHRDPDAKWKIASLIRRNKLIVWQTPVSASNQKTVTRATVRTGNATNPIVPNWWPTLSKPWARRAVDRHGITTTLLGWSEMGVGPTRLRIVNASKRAGLHVNQLVNVGQSGGQGLNADLLFFTGIGREMMVTLSRFKYRTGVVAHLTEVRE